MYRTDLNLFIGASPDAIYSLDRNLNITSWNKAAETLYGWKAGEILGHNCMELYPADKTEEFKQIHLFSKGNKGYLHIEAQQLCKNQTLIWVDVFYLPLLTDAGAITAISRDITEQRSVERSKTEFISMVSHELRTPLTTIIGSLGLLKEMTHAPEVETLLLLAARNADRLALIINDILDVEKLQLGKMKLECKPVVLIQAIQEAINATQPMAKVNQIALIEKAMLPSVQILVDYDRLVQVLLNLLSNAVKYSITGGTVEVRMEMQGEKIRVSVQDWGKGIPLEMQGKIFEKFTAAEQGDTRLKGTGLGLNISKSIVEQMGGAIGFESQLDVGSTFYFEFLVIGE